MENKLKQMSLEEKIGQLLMVPAYSDPKRSNRREVERWITHYHVGGVIFMQGSPHAQVALTNAFQTQSALPLLISMDAEWGPAMRLDSLPRFPNALTLAAVPDDSLVYQVARAIARQCRRLGVHINFAPVADINSNPQNPVIGFRAFGSDRHRVTQLSLLFMHGLQDEGVIAVAKHFPGHGDTHLDSHFDLPAILHDSVRLDSVEFYPFRHLIREGVGGVMVGHLLVPQIDTLTATVSRRVVHDLLRKKLGFQGIIFSDALNMKAVSLYFAPGELEVRALEAGADILLYVENVPVVVRAIHEAVLKGRLLEEEIDEKVRRILMLKAYFGLTQSRSLVPTQGLMADLWAESILQPLREAYIRSVTLLQNRARILPLGYASERKVAYVQIGYERPAPFYRYISQYAAVDAIVLPSFEKSPPDSIVQAMRGYTTFIVSLFNLSNNPRRSFGIRPKLLDFLCELGSAKYEVILCVFGNPYALSFLGEEDATILAYQEDTLAQWQTANIIFGANPPSGRLPISIPMRYDRMVEYDLTPYRPLYPYRLPYSFSRTDSVLRAAVQQKLAPGFAVTVIYRDTIVYSRGAGTLSYTDPRTPSPTHHLYDVASLTKVFATTLMAMDLYEQGKLSLTEPLSVRVPQWAPYPIGKLTPMELLTHTAGFPPGLPLVQELLKEPTALSDTLSETHSIPVSRRRFLHKSYPQKVWLSVRSYPVQPTTRPIYSDLGMVVLKRYMEYLAGVPMESYLAQRFYQPMGLYRVVFYPSQACMDTLCAPTEIDTVWRRDTLCGYVHDPTAALLGGSAGNAGLFASASDLAKILWMLCKGGEYAGYCYLSPTTISTFTREVNRTGRGLGWDKPARDKHSSLPSSFSKDTFGHLGFTGTAAWCDPQRELVVVILSNRVYPTSSDPRFNQLNLRRQIIEAVEYDLRLR
ncbi:MAG: serine hydrolase [Bacteroidia bacterium]|nr:serine hydrolase [Bacteroidia bacterium]MCX7651716.1 serine hydrolase [Bacteroidia bacterium]MDW8417448.1 glycoside hydrolase family 3 N-terminal domain-containing protein [Bacteroidia bacterium]